VTPVPVSSTHVSFVAPVSVPENLAERNEDGLLPTLLFERALVSREGDYVIFESK
jgi:hypothetical protein